MITATHPHAELIGNALGQFIRNDRAFTAWEVTKEVRTKTKDNVRHDGVKEVVHAAFHQGLFGHYGRTLANLPGVEIQPWVYYPPGANLSTYGLGKLTQVIDHDDTDDDPVPVQIAVPVLPSLPTPVATVEEEDDNWDRSVDARESLSVPATLLKEVGFKPGEIACVYANPLNGTALVRKDTGTADLGLVFVKSYTVNLHTNVRITRASLTLAGLPGKDFKVERQGDDIVITAR